MITESILREAQAGNSEAFAVIYNETIKTAYYVAKRILIDEDATEDVLQESYIAVFKHLSDFKTGNLQGWIDTIVANRAKNYLRTKNPILFSEMETEENPVVEFEEEKIEFRPDEKVDYDETKRLVLEIIDNLSPEQRLSIILFYFENKSVKEIAQICECSENTVKSRLNYARKSIKEDVLELEKKGTKLYSISIIPFIIWLLSENAKAASVPPKAASMILSSVNATAQAGSYATATTTTNVATASGSAAASTVAASSTAAPAATSVATTMACKAGMSLGAKIALSFAAVAVILGGAIGGIVATTGNNTETSVTTTYNQNIADTDESNKGSNTETTTETPTEAPTDITSLSAKDVMLNIYGVDVPLIVTKDKFIEIGKKAGWMFYVDQRHILLQFGDSEITFEFRDGATSSDPKETYIVSFDRFTDWDKINISCLDIKEYMDNPNIPSNSYEYINKEIRIDYSNLGFKMTVQGDRTLTTDPDNKFDWEAFGYDNADLTVYGKDEYVNTIIRNIYACEELMNLDYFYRIEVICEYLQSLRIFEFGDTVMISHLRDGSTLAGLTSESGDEYFIHLKHNFTGETIYIRDDRKTIEDIAEAELRALKYENYDRVEDYDELVKVMNDECAKLLSEGKLTEYIIEGYNIYLATAGGIEYVYTFGNPRYGVFHDDIYKGINDAQEEYNQRIGFTG